MLLSIIIPCYNSDRRLLTTLDSILTQELNDTEIILVDDCSTSCCFIENASKLSNIIRIIRNDTNLGLGMARQRGLDEAAGEWIAFVDHDDQLGPQSLAAFYKFVQGKPANILSYTQQVVVAADYRWKETHQYKRFETNNTLHGKYFNHAEMQKYNIHFDPRLKTHEDTFFSGLCLGYESALSKHLNIFDKCTGYVWYLWKDSTSHQTPNFLLENFEDYINSQLYAFEQIYAEYPYITFARPKLISSLLNVYMYCEYFEATEGTFPKYNIVKEYCDKIATYLNLSYVEDLIGLLEDDGYSYHFAYNNVCETMQMFVPAHSISEFLHMLYNA